ncbi:ribokinase [Halodesulfovibrio marinisediminis]|uniref:Ribokinase n=1 Tax=Halodesulfovibrio marinisediminis DSM 17456 TaxID=1121457 RepID=A0A1N6FRT7_9BACT|nr:ribokinase [Halodesulfovibrio marinisediminis]SIN98029.1 ribokinase [Halodesulfovibrio marinisediminis DSM 17456]
MTNKKLVVLGSVNADHILQVDSFPRPGETVTGHGYRVVAGGKGANQAVAAGRLGADIALIACVGNDDFGRNIIKTLSADGILTTGVITVPDTPTGIAIIYVDGKGENSIGISAEANAHLLPEVVEPHLTLLDHADALLMQLESPIITVELMARLAHHAGKTVVLNPAPARPLPDSLLANVTMITPNETETEILTGVTVKTEEEARKAAAVFHAKGVEKVIITLGSKGAFISDELGMRTIAGFSVSPVDTTAAGDVFNGALITALLEGKTMDDAVRFAHGAAAISVTRLGAQTSIPTRNEVDTFIEKEYCST